MNLKQTVMNRQSVPGFLFGMLLMAQFTLAPVASAQGPSPDDELPRLSREQVEWIVREYLLNNPEVIEQGMSVLQERREREAAEQARKALTDRADELFNDDMDPLVGNPDGPVQMVHFFDYQCGYCKSMSKNLGDTLTADGDVRAKFKEFPILGQISVVAARAALAAEKQGQYMDFHQALMANRGRLTETRIFSIAQNLGLDVARLRLDMKDPAIDEQFLKNRQLAAQLGITGTPGFVIGDQIYPTSMQPDVLRRVLDDAKRKAGNQTELDALNPRG